VAADTHGDESRDDGTAGGETTDGGPTDRYPAGAGPRGGGSAVGADPRADGGAPPVPGAQELLVVFLKGIAMGAADTVPGVSGGTIALITGIYERFVRALTALDPRLLAGLATLHRAQGRREFRRTLRRVDAFFLVALGLGVVTSVVALSRVVHAAVVAYEPQTFAFFFGLIGASAVVLSDQLAVRTPGRLGAAVVGFAAAFLLAGASASGLFGHALPVVFAAGAVAVTAMVLPGVSGAFVLLLLGQYAYLTGVLTAFVDAVVATVTGGGTDGLVAGATVVVTFAGGGVVGLLSVAHLIRRALDRYRGATLAFLVSLMVGSLRLPVETIAGGVGVWTPASALSVAVPAAVGAGAVLALDRYTDDLEYA
jgi:putative membrane protein